MKNTGLLILLVLFCIVSLHSQFTILPKSGEGRLMRSESAVFLQDPQFLKPSIFWSPEKIDFQINRKWWRNPPSLPQLKYTGLELDITQGGLLFFSNLAFNRSIGTTQNDSNYHPIFFTSQNLEPIQKHGNGIQFQFVLDGQQKPFAHPSNHEPIINEENIYAFVLQNQLGQRWHIFESISPRIIYYNYLFQDHSILMSQIEQKNGLFNPAFFAMQ